MSYMHLFMNQKPVVQELRRTIKHQTLLVQLKKSVSLVLQEQITILENSTLFSYPPWRTYVPLPDLPDLDPDIARSATTETMSPPQIRWRFTNPRGRTPPTVVPARSCTWEVPWSGRLYLAPLDAVIAKDTLEYYRVSLVINCLGLNMNGSINSDWRISQKRKQSNILYINFPVGYGIRQLPWADVFTKIKTNLENGNVVFVHCKNGTDRSGFALFAFLRITYCLSQDVILKALSGRIRAQDFPFTYYNREIAWLNAEWPSRQTW